MCNQEIFKKGSVNQPLRYPAQTHTHPIFRGRQILSRLQISVSSLTSSILPIFILLAKLHVDMR